MNSLEQTIKNSMGEPKPNFRWSFSQWETYESCPQKWNFASVLKLPRTPPGPAAARGLDMHDRAEKYIKGELDDPNTFTLNPDGSVMMFGDKPPARIHLKYIPILDSFKHHPNGDRHTEKKVAFDSGWYLCGPRDQHASAIAVLDAVRVGGDRYDKHDTSNGKVFIGEWKSGKPKDTHADQRKLYAMFGAKLFLSNHVEATTYYFEDTGPPQRLILNSDAGFERLKALWDARINEMRTNRILAPRPGFHCNWCDFAKSKGGPCSFGAGRN